MNPDSNADRFVIRGQVHVSLQAVARCFDVRISWVEEIYEQGLLGSCQRVDNRVAIAAAELDRVARIVRLHFCQGIDLAGIVFLMGTSEAEPTEQS